MSKANRPPPTKPPTATDEISVRVYRHRATLVWASILLHALSGCSDTFLGDLVPVERKEVGWIEKVRVFPANMVLHAKLDTGADHGSLHATNIKKFFRDNKPWVRFTVVDRHGQEKTMVRRVVRIARIKRKLGKPQERYVVRLVVCLSGTRLETDVNLVDRSNFSYPMLIGRSFLEGNFVLDPSKSYLSEPECDGS